MKELKPLPLSDLSWVESPALWSELASAHRYLGELKGICESLPNQSILLDTLCIQEAKDSSEIENIITTHDEIFTSQEATATTPAAKEVRHYGTALREASETVRQSGLIRLRTVLTVQKTLEEDRAGLRAVPGTVLKNQLTGETVYTPPQDATEISFLMENLIDFIHATDGLDPLIRMAVAHHQFESIHPFYDGNGRTGRILNLLILQREGLLDVPVLYLSRYITTTKPDYYRLLRQVREHPCWLDWCLYMVRGISCTARSAVSLVREMRELMFQTKYAIRRDLPKIYSQDLLCNLFRHPYTKIEFVEKDLHVSRITAAKYLDQLVQAGFLKKEKRGKTNFYINTPLFRLLTNVHIRPDK